MSGRKEMEQGFVERLARVVGKENIRLEEPMAKHTTFQIGGPAQVFVTPETIDQIQQVVMLCNEDQTPFFVLGNGSNLLVSDLGMDGVVIQLYQNFSACSVDGNLVKAEAGTMLAAIGSMAADAGLAGFEFASGIPGTLGGAVMMNAGAYGGEMRDIVRMVRLMDQAGHVFEKNGEEMEFGYRKSIVEREHYIVLDAVLELAPGQKEAIRTRMKELAEARRKKQPLEYPSAGSTFKRPEGYFAGKLIMEADLKGYQVGGAQISEKHCGFVVNRGGATADDVLCLIRDVQDRVEEIFQVRLEPEVKLVGRQIEG